MIAQTHNANPVGLRRLSAILREQRIREEEERRAADNEAYREVRYAIGSEVRDLSELGGFDFD
jgi:hypothetical protein